jgi:hypothetical protein
VQALHDKMNILLSQIGQLGRGEKQELQELYLDLSIMFDDAQDSILELTKKDEEG